MLKFHDRIEDCTRRTGRDLPLRISKIVEELGELSEVCLVAVGQKDKRFEKSIDEAMLEETVDVMMCAYSIIADKPELYHRFEEMLHKKIEKWELSLEKYSKNGRFDTNV